MDTPNFDQLRTRVVGTAEGLYDRRSDAADAVKSVAGVIGSQVTALPARAYSALPSVKRRRRNRQIAIAAGVVIGVLVAREVYKRRKLRGPSGEDTPRGTRTPSLSTIQFRQSS